MSSVGMCAHTLGSLPAFCEAESCGAELRKMPHEGALQKELLALLLRKYLKHQQACYGLFLHLQIRTNPAYLDVMKDTKQNPGRSKTPKQAGRYMGNWRGQRMQF